MKPKTLEDLIEVVNEFVASLDEAKVRRAVRPRAELSCASKWGAAISSLSYRNTREAQFRSCNIHLLCLKID